MGIQGAALATVISQGVTAIWGLSYYLRGKSNLKFIKSSLKLNSKLVKEIFAIGGAPAQSPLRGGREKRHVPGVDRLTLSPCHLHRAGGKGMRGSPAGLLCGAARLGLPEAPGQLETPRLREGGGDREKERGGLYSLRAPPADSWQGHHTSVLQPQGAGCSPPRSASPGTGSSTGCLDENTALLTP